uniref:Uncharacterized protein n=1 Tax=Oryza barthii TaxID=65489 RepID=A0A0D3FV87_9ORYZ
MGASNLWLGDMNDGGVSTMRATRDRDDRQSDCTSPSFRRPITKTCARQLNLQVSLFLSIFVCDFEDILLRNDLITIIRNYGKNQEALEERLEDGQCHHGHSSQDGGLIHIKFKSTSDSRSGPH